MPNQSLLMLYLPLLEPVAVCRGAVLGVCRLCFTVSGLVQCAVWLCGVTV